MATYTTHRHTHTVTNPLTLKLSTRYTPLSHPASPALCNTPHSYFSTPTTRSPITPLSPITPPSSATQTVPFSSAAYALLLVLSLLTPSSPRVSEALFLDTFHVFSAATSPTPPLKDFPVDAQSYVAARRELVRAGCVRWTRKRGELVLVHTAAACALSDHTDDEAERAWRTLVRLGEGAREVGVSWR